MKPVLFFQKVGRPLAVLLIIPLLIVGCTDNNSAKLAGPADKYLAGSLKLMKSTAYRFTGAGKVQYMGVQGQGNFTLSGAYKPPDQSSIKMQMKLGGANFYSEALFRNKVGYQLLNETWKKVVLDPNTLVQPGYKPVEVILAQIPQISSTPIWGQDEEVDGKKLKVIKVLANSKKLKSFLQKEFNKAIALEPERSQELKNFLKNSYISQFYTLYIDPDNNRIVKVTFSQRINLTIAENKMETQLVIDYVISDFGANVTMPALTEKGR